MKIKHALLLVVCIWGCQKPEEKLKAKIEPIIRKLVIQDSLASKIDSINIYKIDTLTDIDYAYAKMTNAKRKIDYYIESSKNYFSQADLTQSNANIKISQAKLYYQVLDSKVLGETSVQDARDDMKEAMKLAGEAKLYADSAKQLTAYIQTIEKQLKGKKTDSTTFRGYIVNFRLQGANDRNEEVKKDSLSLYLSPTFHAINMGKIR